MRSCCRYLLSMVAHQMTHLYTTSTHLQTISSLIESTNTTIVEAHQNIKVHSTNYTMTHTILITQMARYTHNCSLLFFLSCLLMFLSIIFFVLMIMFKVVFICFMAIKLIICHYKCFVIIILQLLLIQIRRFCCNNL